MLLKRMLQLKDALEVRRKRLMLSKRNENTFKPCIANIESKLVTSPAPILHPSQTEHAKNIFKSVWEEVPHSTDSDAFWSYNLCDKNTSFIGTIQIYSDRTATIIKTNKTNDIVEYLVRIVLLKLTKSFRRFLIAHEHKLVALLPISTYEISCEYYEKGESGVALKGVEDVVPLLTGLTMSMTKNVRSVKLEGLYGALQTNLGPIISNVLRGFSVYSQNELQKCHPIVVSCCCDTRKGERYDGR